MPRGEAKEHIQEIRQQQFWLDDGRGKPRVNPLRVMLSRALEQLAKGIFEHAHHYIFELIQNADDNSYAPDAERFLKFDLLENDPTDAPGSQGCLCVLNNETGFERKDVQSLCDIGMSVMTGNRQGYIGEKGIGFKSVFLISDRPHIVSNGYSFHFRRVRLSRQYRRNRKLIAAQSSF
jgi:HSP90 family molecular chaperone